MQDTYQIVSKQSPLITVIVQGVSLSSFSSIGDGLTTLAVSRVGAVDDTYYFNLLEQIGQKFVFAAPAEFLNNKSGRYQYTLYYRGNDLGLKQFIFTTKEFDIIGL